MTRWPDDARREAGDAQQEGSAPGTPDVSAAVMRRLGYVPVTRAQAERERWLARAGRLAAGGALAFLFLIAFQVHDRVTARRPQGPTLPGAIGRDVSLQQERFRNTLRTLQKLAPAGQQGDVAPSRDEAAEDGATKDEAAILGPIC
jgi:hypothetical protein